MVSVAFETTLTPKEAFLPMEIFSEVARVSPSSERHVCGRLGYGHVEKHFVSVLHDREIVGEPFVLALVDQGVAPSLFKRLGSDPCRGGKRYRRAGGAFAGEVDAKIREFERLGVSEPERRADAKRDGAAAFRTAEFHAGKTDGGRGIGERHLGAIGHDEHRAGDGSFGENGFAAGDGDRRHVAARSGERFDALAGQYERSVGIVEIRECLGNGNVEVAFDPERVPSAPGGIERSYEGVRGPEGANRAAVAFKNRSTGLASVNCAAAGTAGDAAGGEDSALKRNERRRVLCACAGDELYLAGDVRLAAAHAQDGALAVGAFARLQLRRWKDRRTDRICR